MMHRTLFLVFFLSIGLAALPSCGDDSGSDMEVCDDGIDNDGDGFTDCSDFDCASECREFDCDDGTDNDGDGFTDCEDNDCVEFCPQEICNDGVDNDMDGFTDCEDLDCDGDPSC